MTVSYNRYLILLIILAQLDVRAHTRVLALTGRRTRGLFLGFAHDIYIKMQPINKFFQSIFNEHVIDGQQTQFQYVFKPSEIRQETVGDLQLYGIDETSLSINWNQLTNIPPYIQSSLGTVGQLLYSNGTITAWLDQSSLVILYSQLTSIPAYI